MTLPSASTLTDEQLRVLCKKVCPGACEFSTWRRIGAGHSMYTEQIDPLTDKNAAFALLDNLKRDKYDVLHFSIEYYNNEFLVSIYKYKTLAARHTTLFPANAPNLCRAIVLAFLRAEGKIL